MLTFIYPPPAILIEDPIVSFTFIPLKSNDPPSDTKIAEETSGSLGSWEKENNKSTLSLHSKLPNDTLTVGLKGIHGKLPVTPPTQLPQESI